MGLTTLDSITGDIATDIAEDVTVGTITGWRLITHKLLSEAVADAENNVPRSGSSPFILGSGSSSLIPAYQASASSSSLSKLLSCSFGAASDVSGSSTSSITPRPQHFLFKEYQFLEEIGSGGFARVYKARHLLESKIVVIKEIRTTTLTDKQKRATLDEVEVLSALDHPNIVRYHECFMDDSLIHIIMEYCDAGDLSRYLKSRGGVLLTEEEVMDKFVQICLALLYVHMKGILHRDLKTNNIFCTRDQMLKLGDFGVSKLSNSESSLVTTIVGTPHYLSPEICDNKPYGKKSDIWALGCVLCELATLRHAFEESSISKIVLKILSGKHSPVPSVFSSELASLVAAMLSPNPDDRPGVFEVLRMPFVRSALSKYLERIQHTPCMQSTSFQSCLQALETGRMVPRTTMSRLNLGRAEPSGGNQRKAVSSSTSSRESSQEQLKVGSTVFPAANGEDAPKVPSSTLMRQEQLLGLNKLRKLKDELKLSLQ